MLDNYPYFHYDYGDNNYLTTMPDDFNNLVFYIDHNIINIQSKSKRLKKEFREYYYNVRKERDNGNSDGWNHYADNFERKLYMNFEHYAISQFYNYTITNENLIAFSDKYSNIYFNI